MSLSSAPKEASRRLEKLLLSAISNWQAKNEGVRIEDSNLYVKNWSMLMVVAYSRDYRPLHREGLTGSEKDQTM